MHLGDEFVVGTDLPYETINKEYHKRVSPEHSTINTAFLLSFILSAKTDAYFAANYMAELITGPISSKIISSMFNQLIAKRTSSASSIEMFQQIHLDNSRALRDVINSGERTFVEFLTLLEHAERFRSWLGERNPDSNLLAEYHKAVTAKTWLDRVATKSVRLAVTSGVGVGADLLLPTGGLGTLAGVAFSAVDALLLDKLVHGWKPNQFVEGELRNFVKPEDRRQ